ncbi:MAG: helix-turn-helix domain-containing protein [Bacteroidetes bacterium]|nr:helix-turn-helix domain-containing protein [Bacteroidota bacterium]
MCAICTYGANSEIYWQERTDDVPITAFVEPVLKPNQRKCARLLTALANSAYFLAVARMRRSCWGLAGAYRFLWNAMLARQNEAYEQANEAGNKPLSVSFFSLDKRFMCSDTGLDDCLNTPSRWFAAR